MMNYKNKVFKQSIIIINKYILSHRFDTDYYSVNILNALKEILENENLIFKLFGCPVDYKVDYCRGLFNDMIKEYINILNEELSKLTTFYFNNTDYEEGDSFILAEICFDRCVGFLDLFYYSFYRVLFLL